MELLILPVSGGRMFAQLGQLQQLTCVGYKPDIILSSSGGNFAAYIAMAAQWQFHSIARISSQLSPSLFATPWISIGFLDTVVGFFSGSLYAQGKGGLEFMESIFNNETIKSCEIWTGMYNSKRQKTRLSCNKIETLIDPELIDYGMMQLMRPYYPDCIKGICNACIASASIPAIVPPQFIEDEYYEDGGVASASPLTFMKAPIRKLGPNLHLTYINTFNFANPDQDENSVNMTGNIKRATNTLIRSLTAIDLADAQDILIFYSETSEVEKISFPCTTHNLNVVKRMKRVVNRSFLEIYPNWDMGISITSFNTKDVENALKDGYENSSCCFRWVGPVSSEMKELISELEK